MVCFLKLIKKNLSFLVVIVLPSIGFTQLKTEYKKLNELSNQYQIVENIIQKNLNKLVIRNNWEKQKFTKNPNQIIYLTGVDPNGFPIYTSTDNNAIAAATTRTKQLWQNNNLGISLSGSSANMKGKLGIWDGGIAMNNHIEIDGRIINKDASSTINHTTHVAGTMIAKGVNPNAKGMAFAAEELQSYDFNNHISEMASAAGNLLISNHSYGVVAGWNLTGAGNWEYWGSPNENEDYKFGIYNDECQMFDSIAYNAPNYLIVKSVGNNRDKNGPAVGQPYKRLDASGTMISAGNRPAGISNNDGYDIIPTYGVAKNILTVGAVEGIASGIATIQNIKLGSFSNWGPTDDGRLKPDLVADGVDVYSSVANTTTSYDTYNGTSMAAPNVSASLFLLQELYSQKNAGIFMKSATLKALSIHTTTDAGTSDGPDYQFGWGLLNVEKAAKIINENNLGTNRIIEGNLINGSTYSLNVIASGDSKLIATLVWTDPTASPTTINLLNNPAQKLINDLDIRITKNSTTYFPWILNPSTPSLAATKGDNFRDNIERIDIDDVVPGQSYNITITHKAALRNGSQAYSLILSGVGGTIYCSASPTYFSGSRIDNLSFSNLNNNNPAGCTQYSNFTNQTARIESNKTYPLTIDVSSCDGSFASKFIKVYIDYNKNGSFTDAGELVAMSNIINGDGSFTTTITTPNYLKENIFTLMRVVLQETNDANNITPCNTFNHGEIQDYRVFITSPAIDASIIDIANPFTNACASSNQLLSVRIFNKGNSDISNIPINAIIKSGNTIVSNLTAVYTPVLKSGETVLYTFQTTFATNANTNYSIVAYTNISNDQNKNNDTLTTNFNTLSSASMATGQANICSTSVNLRAFNTNTNQNYFWYNNIAATTPIARGVSTSSTTIAPLYYLSSGVLTTVGPTTKNDFTDGDYQAKGGNYLKYNTTVPLLLEKAKIYTAYPGKVFIIVADINTINGDGSYTYKTLSSTTLDVVASRPTIVRGDVVGNDVSDSGRMYNINLLMPIGNHVIIVSTDSVANIYRSKNITANPYPYSISNLFSITGNNATNPNSFYYYLYNLSIKSLDCVTDRIQITPVTATPPTISLVNDSLKSNVGINYQWLRNDTIIIAAINQTYKPTSSGNYSCKVTDNLGCEQKSNTIFYEVVSNTNDVTIYPNPANNYINVSLKKSTNTFTIMNIVDALGKVCMSNIYNSLGNFNQKINIANLKNGVYTLQIIQGTTYYQQKFIVAR